MILPEEIIGGPGSVRDRDRREGRRLGGLGVGGSPNQHQEAVPIRAPGLHDGEAP